MSMSPFRQASLVYEREPCARPFVADLSFHHANGYVFSTPEFFVMGRAVPRYAPRSQIVGLNVFWSTAACDCWHVYLMAGDMRAALAMFPYPLPWVSFERSNRLRFYPFDRLNHLISKMS
ncbi:hypothetical protein OpiT1DRAFT_03854 [Opitutaceae bacterium TAV1]|nr:hypothetical protein OpiT1DRAFT_03854 [Opitutaceae bacterium TAV1]